MNRRCRGDDSYSIANRIAVVITCADDERNVLDWLPGIKVYACLADCLVSLLVVSGLVFVE